MTAQPIGLKQAFITKFSFYRLCTALLAGSNFAKRDRNREL